MLSLFRGRAAEPVDAPPEGIDLVLDTLAHVLRTYGRHAFDVNGTSAEEISAECDLWTHHALHGRPLPGEDPTPIPVVERSWSEVRRFFAKVRGNEAEFVGKSIASMRGALWTFVETFRKAFDEDAATDGQIREQLARLRDVSASADPDTLRQTVHEVSANLEEALEERARRQAAAVDQLGVRLQQVRADLKQARREAVTDPLTEVPNRAAFDERLASGALLNSYGSQPESLLLLDLDHFKRVNDEHGHRAGDHVLKEVARVLETVVVRRSDFVARYGGEEFAVILDDTDESSAVRVAERLLRAVRELEIEWEGESISLTVSIGASTIRPGDSAATWLEEADQAMYRAKDTGRDQVAVRPPP
ncbi:MAG: diguanylate cyclase [Proteobacteria bacterium]|nr:diguanylate cyclase [Pseudomonadota bacterium]